MDELNLMGLNADICFTYDGAGRMLHTNEPVPSARRPAPRLFLGRTRAGTIVRFSAGVPDAVARNLTTLVDQVATARDLEAPLAQADDIRATLGALATETAGPAFHFPHAIPPAPEATPIGPGNRDLVRPTFAWLCDEVTDWQPTFAVVRGGAAVAVCFSSRIGPTACAAGVETLPDFRGRGYAATVTAAWAAAVRAAGQLPVYSTSWDNLGSRGVARRLGLVMFGSENTWS